MQADADDGVDFANLSRELHWNTMLDPAWWETWGDDVSPSFHAYLFGFSTPAAMKDFYEVFFDKEAKEAPVIGLTPYQLYALALLRMRRGWPVQLLAALTGANRPRLGPRTDVWIHRLGAVGKLLIGVPHIDYLLASMPATFVACGMKNCCAVGDATDFLTETPRSSFLKKAHAGCSSSSCLCCVRQGHSRAAQPTPQLQLLLHAMLPCACKG